MRLQDKKAVGPVTDARHLQYVDNLVMMGAGSTQVREQLERAVARLRDAGLIVHEEEYGDADVDGGYTVLGWRLEKQGRARPTPRGCGVRATRCGPLYVVSACEARTWSASLCTWSSSASAARACLASTSAMRSSPSTATPRPSFGTASGPSSRCGRAVAAADARDALAVERGHLLRGRLAVWAGMLLRAHGARGGSEHRAACRTVALRCRRLGGGTAGSRPPRRSPRRAGAPRDASHVFREAAGRCL